MESNGKMVDIEGRPVEFDTGEVVFGEPGTNGQHSFYQLIHQGTQIIPADFIGVIQPQYRIGEASWMTVTHHEELMTNFFAQPDALAFGKEDTNLAKHFPGNRPSSSYLLAKLTPFEAGLLLALTEHRTAVKGFIWGLNSFDQFGVELGKKLGVELRNRILKEHKTGLVDLQGLNPSTAALLQAYMLGQLPT
jgi:glucose-6-phosphate isomerase